MRRRSIQESYFRMRNPQSLHEQRVDQRALAKLAKHFVEQRFDAGAEEYDTSGSDGFYQNVLSPSELANLARGFGGPSAEAVANLIENNEDAANDFAAGLFFSYNNGVVLDLSGIRIKRIDTDDVHQFMEDMLSTWD